MTALWLPILLSALFVFVLSGILHMALPWHKKDLKPLPDEEGYRAALKPFPIPPGDYMVPNYQGGNFHSPEYKKKVEEGPVQIMTVLPNASPSMGCTFVQWFVFLVVISFFTAYVTFHAVPAQAHYLAVFRIAGAVAFLAYAGAQWPQSIWLGKSWTVTVKSTIDGLLYGLVTAGTFAWLWPRE